MTDSDRSERRRPAFRPWRFGLGTLLLAFGAIATWLAIIVNQAQLRIEVVAEVEALGGEATLLGHDQPGHYAPGWLRKLIGDERFPRLDRIGLAQTEADDELVRKTCRLKGIRSLDVTQTKITDAGLRDIGRLQSLKALSIGFNDVTDAAMPILSDLPQLVYLNLSVTKVTDSGLASLRTLPSLYTLDLFGTDVTDSGMTHLVQIQALGEIDLAETNVTDAGLSVLAEKQNLTRLRLDESGFTPTDPPRVTDEGLAHIAKMTNLRDLGLVSLHYTDTGLKYLHGLQSLRSLTIYCHQEHYTDDGVTELKRALPSCTVKHW